MHQQQLTEEFTCPPRIFEISKPSEAWSQKEINYADEETKIEIKKEANEFWRLSYYRGQFSSVSPKPLKKIKYF